MWTIIILGCYLLGCLAALHVLSTARTAQGATAWMVALLTLPILSLPLYLVFGRARFQGYVFQRGRSDLVNSIAGQQILKQLQPFIVNETALRPEWRVGVSLSRTRCFRDNSLELLPNGEATFRSIRDGMQNARSYVLIQFYIVRPGKLAVELKRSMIECAARGVAVYFSCDELGSYSLGQDYLTELKTAGVKVCKFGSRRGKGNLFQFNFRNHRKVVVVDGKYGWVGGHNVGDEYMGWDPKFGNWRDTQIRIDGPATLALQMSFLEDWYWSTGELLMENVSWSVETTGSGKVLVIMSGPADEVETGSLLYQNAINAAQARFWLATPYFVPDESNLSALQLAAMRGVDVRVIIPQKSDNTLVDIARWRSIGALKRLGVRFYFYQNGFLHSKHFVMDDNMAAVGTCNFDNRSMRLNFEVTALCGDTAFIEDMDEQFIKDFADCEELKDIPQRVGIFARLTSGAARILEPVL